MAHSYNDQHRKEALENGTYIPRIKFERKTKIGYITEVLRQRYESKARSFYDLRDNGDLTERLR